MSTPNSRRVYSHKYFSLEEEDLKLKDDQYKTYTTVHRRPVSVVFPISEKKEIYLISQYRYLFKKNIIEAVSGHSDDEEDPLETARRELKEEAGITAKKWEKIFDFYSSASIVNSFNSIFIASDLKMGKPTPDEGEQIEILKLSIEGAMEKVINGEIKTSSSIIGI
jgi:ADP-ribose pyrophosphatase